ETWAHYFHMVDTLETASSFGLVVAPKTSRGLTACIDFDAHEADIVRVIEAWIPLTFAVNSMNRSMGLPDLYPFVLGPPVIAKLGFVHARIHAHAVRQTDVKSGVRSILASLRRRTVLPTERTVP